MRLAPLCLAMTLGLAACGTPESRNPSTGSVEPAAAPASELWMYQARTDVGPKGEPIEIAAVRQGYLNERNRRQQVPYNGPEPKDTIVVDPYARVLYHVLGNGQAMRFGVAVGRAGRGFSGDATIRRKAAWPSWTPTANMVRTEPELYYNVRHGLPGGLQNPLGARALYLYQGGTDTMYRIHGTMDPSSIGKATSAGCIRLFQQDIMDLYDELPLGAPVKVRSQAESLRLEGPMIETPQGYMVPAPQAPVQATAPVQASATVNPYVGSPVESAVPSRF
ncbi:MAG: L,D-transpeptidase [Paracoccus sp. (in: a-proteobacteria)]|uniref:L,D-transpeptidase n=1 Tax=Paracoccus sp. TaxID=267 RepID=UPI0026DEFC37|nr:L,D-transpeptidase [Paracoccus sp. (in: a-proteobacteria)]MDO5632505.1 L,D-transpeptidase [Paracoccus sp. (in: a-proteobacteria)]